MSILLSYLPIVVLVFLMLKPKPMPSFKAVPIAAGLIYLLALLVFKYSPLLVHATVFQGILLALTPITIIGCAIFLFKTMETTGGLATIRAWLNTVSENKIAQLMMLGWAFPFLIEGASGFGTPAAIAAPILVGLGFPPVRIAIMILVMNTVPVAFGAVGTPTWFGFTAVNLSQPELLTIGFKTALLNGSAALVIPFVALSFVVGYKSIRQNSVFILLSVFATVVPFVAISYFNYEFPSLIGGFIGLATTIWLAKKGIGLSTELVLMHRKVDTTYVNPFENLSKPEKVPFKTLVKASFPIWGTLLLLILTRIPQLGIKGVLLAKNPHLNADLHFIGELQISPALVLTINHLFGTALSWTHSLLYVPSFLPFVLVSAIAIWWNNTPKVESKRIVSNTLGQLKKPTITLMAALVFVGLMMCGGTNSAVAQIGQNLASLTGHSWTYFASFLGALGSFFSGSNTVSNLTFGGIQDSIALSLGLDRTTILALQNAGGSMGAMVSINNIVAVVTVLSLHNQEGYILKKTFRALLAYGAIIALVAVFL